MTLYFSIRNIALAYVLVNFDVREGYLEDMDIGIREEIIYTLDYAGILFK